jgi:exopolysaccharide biosynthesis WecB/TagA/CpsF family protein
VIESDRGIRHIEILGIRFARLSAAQAVDEAEALYERREPAWIAVENVHAVNLATADGSHREVLDRAGLVLNDGKGVMLGARILGDRFPDDLNGNAFTPLLLERAAQRGWPVFLLGAAPGVVERAARILREEHTGLQVVGTHHGFLGPDDHDAVVRAIRTAGTGLLLVGMGMPLQERWVDRHLAATGARLASTVGAFFDFRTGEVPRAPAWLNRIGLEWAYRLVMEPRRLWRRYLLGNPLFMYRVGRQRLSP